MLWFMRSNVSATLFQLACPGCVWGTPPCLAFPSKRYRHSFSAATDFSSSRAMCGLKSVWARAFSSIEGGLDAFESQSECEQGTEWMLFSFQGTIVFPNIASSLYDPEQWETPRQFNPGHFLDKDGNFVAQEAFLPFSIGKWATAQTSTVWIATVEWRCLFKTYW